MTKVLTPITGTGKDGTKVFSSNGQFVTIRRAMTATVGNTYASCTSTSINPGDLVMLIKSRGISTTLCGEYEFKYVQSVGSGVVNFYTPVERTYNELSQLIVIPQYTSSIINGGVTVTPSGWDGSTGGIDFVVCQGQFKIDGGWNADGSDGVIAGGNPTTSNGGGYRGGKGDAVDAPPNTGQQGESYAGSQSFAYANNYGGGGGGYQTGAPGGVGGGGGAHASNGSAASGGNGLGNVGQAGVAYGTSDGSRLTMGSGGGGSAREYAASTSSGGNGGGILGVICDVFDCSTGYMYSRGGDGRNSGNDDDSGAGAGGMLYVKCRKAILGTDHLSTIPGAQAGVGGAGSKGHIRIECSEYTGSISASLGGITISKADNEFLGRLGCGY